VNAVPSLTAQCTEIVQLGALMATPEPACRRCSERRPCWFHAPMPPLVHPRYAHEDTDPAALPHWHPDSPHYAG
jgi:hypothetical protein